MNPWASVGQIFSVLCWILALAWLRQAIICLGGMSQLPDLTSIDMTEYPLLTEGQNPHLTVIVPACNEENSIRNTLQSLLASTGLRLQIIAVDDRSTDKTGIIMDEVAAKSIRDSSEHSLLIIHNHELPAGWLGKPHALHLAAQRAISPWLLFTDGDVVFAPRALEHACRYADFVHTDHLVLMPWPILSGPFEAAMMAVIQALSQWSFCFWKVADMRSKDYLGVGAFNMIRTKTYTQIGGYAALRMEILEDLFLGRMVKESGNRSSVALGPEMISIRWIECAFDVVRNVEKNGFAAFHYSIGLSTAACLALAIQIAFPLLAIAKGGWTLPAGVLTYLAIALAYWANRRLNGITPLASLLFAPAGAILCFGFARSMVLTLTRKGVTWRSVHYPLDELRRNAARWK